MGEQPLALEGMRVIDLTWYLPGPFCSMLLADLGAEVIRVERPDGDPVRQLRVRMGEENALHWWVNRNKKSIVLDLKTPDGLAAYLDLVRQGDVVLEGFRPGVADRLGVGYEACRAANPSIIYCALTGYGQTGPDRNTAGHDLNYAARGGLLDLTGPRGSAPSMIGFPVGDVAAGGMLATVGVLAAYAYRQRTGEGQFVDVGILDGCVALAGMQLIQALAGHVAVRGEDMNSGGDPFYRVYATADGRYVSIGAVEPYFWRRLCELIDRPEWVEHQYDRRWRERIEGELAEIFRSQPLAYWCERFEGEDVCFGPVNPIDRVPDDPQVQARGLITRMADRQGRQWPQIASPLHLSRTPARLRTPAPALGEHTGAVLDELRSPREVK